MLDRRLMEGNWRTLPSSRSWFTPNAGAARIDVSGTVVFLYRSPQVRIVRDGTSVAEDGK